MKATLKKIGNLEEAVHVQSKQMPVGEVTEGTFYTKPTPGLPFAIFQTEERTEDGWLIGGRVRATSLVTSIVEETNEKLVFRTLNSTYELNFAAANA